jgi:rubrerythrin
MGIRFNADEIFEMAVHIEENAAAFYRKAAGFQGEEKHRAFLESLASMEDNHKAVFEEMRRELGEREKEGQAFDPEGEASMYLEAMADSHGGEGSPAAVDSLNGDETLEQILKTALELEKKSILYYVGLRDRVPERQGKERLDDIISEERRHVSQIMGAMKSLGA